MFLMKIPYKDTYWVIPDKILAGRTPYCVDKQATYNNLSALLAHKIDLIINLTEEGEFPDYENELMFFAKGINRKVEILRKAIPDFGIPDKKLMKDILNIIETALQKDKRVFVHCYGGIGRTGTLVGSYLLQNRLAEKENVFEKIKALRSRLGVLISPETDEQKQFVLDWNI